MKTIKLVVQYTYGLTVCARCSHMKNYHCKDMRSGKPRNTNMDDLRRFAREDGWTQDKRRQWICPNCSKGAAS